MLSCGRGCDSGSPDFTEPGRGFSSPVLGLLGFIKHCPSSAQQTAQQEKFGGWIWVPFSMGKRRLRLVSDLSCLAAAFGNMEEQCGVHSRGSARPAALSPCPVVPWLHPDLSSNLQNQGWGSGSLPRAAQTLLCAQPGMACGAVRCWLLARAGCSLLGWLRTALCALSCAELPCATK